MAIGTSLWSDFVADAITQARPPRADAAPEVDLALLVISALFGAFCGTVALSSDE